MAITVKMPRYGATMEEGTIASWMVKEGDAVSKGQPLGEIEIEKLTNELESPADGIVLKLLAAEGETLPCGAGLIMIGGEGEDLSEDLSGPAGDAAGPGSGESETTGHAGPESVKITPKALKLAGELGMDHRLLKGTGIHGMITREDIRAASREAPGAAGTEAGMSAARKATSRRMMESLRTTAQTTIMMDADITDLVGSYGAAKKQYHAEGVRLTYTAIILKAAAQALVHHPEPRRMITGEGTVTTYTNIDIGVAVDSGNGLFVPVLKGLDRKSLAEICGELTGAGDRVRAESLLPGEMSGGVMTVSNVGAYGVKYFTPILNAPQSTILGVGTLTREPGVRNGGLYFRWILALNLTFDHRIVDGAPAARFLGEIRDRIGEMKLELQ